MPNVNPNTVDALAGLRDIHLPDAVSWWPPAPGWWLTLALLVACAIGLLLVRRWRRASARQAALRELENLAQRFRAGASADASTLAAELSALLRRFSLARFSRADVASLHGDARAEFFAGARRAGFPPALALSLERAVYARPAGDAACDAGAAGSEGEAWIAATRRWIGRRS